MELWRTVQVDELFNAFLKLRNTDEIADFCRDLMTEPEIEEFASRYQIAKKLYIGESQRKIAKELSVSITTVTRVNQWLQRGEGGYKNVLSKVVGIRKLTKRNKELKNFNKSEKRNRQKELHHHKSESISL